MQAGRGLLSGLLEPASLGHLAGSFLLASQLHQHRELPFLSPLTAGKGEKGILFPT